MLFRILTEKIENSVIGQPQRTIDLVAKFFDGFTMLEGKGYWQGKPEGCLIFEIETEKKDPVLWLANQIKLQNNQQAVLVEVCKSTKYMV
jgi:hypothetical protein